MPLPLDVEQPTDAPLRVALEPARNAIASMYLLLENLELPGVHEWIPQTLSQFSLEETDRHKLVIMGFFYSILPGDGWASFPAYLDHLSNTDPLAIRQKLFDGYTKVCGEKTGQDIGPVDWKEVLSSADKYVGFLEKNFPPQNVDPDLEAVAYRYVIDPPALKKLLVDHLRWVWDRHLAAEWTRVRPILQDSVRAFQKIDFNGLDRMEATRLVVGRELPEAKWMNHLEKAERITFIPNAHIGPYTKILSAIDSLGIIFGARQPENSEVRIPDLDRAELVVRLSALADDTRLRILQMVSENQEMRSQEIMEALSLSQPTTSRYLTQLTATGYLQERRSNTAKVYVLNPQRIELTLKAVAAFLIGKK